MSDEVKETREEKNSVSMYVHNVEWDVVVNILKEANNANKMFTFNMPKRAASYVGNGFELLDVINTFSADEDEKWRIGVDTNVSIIVMDDCIQIGDWKIASSNLNICIPAINSIIIVPNEESTYKGGNEPTKVIQLVNCIAIKPMLLRLSDVPVEGKADKFDLGVTFEMIITENAKSDEEELPQSEVEPNEGVEQKEMDDTENPPD